MELFKASRQWATRPSDERFWNVQELAAMVTSYRANARERSVPYASLAAVPDGDEVLLENTETKNTARLSHWAFGQLSQRAKAPASYLRDLPAPLASDCINYGLSDRADGEIANLMFHQNGSLLTRAITSERYDRIWNADVTPHLVDLADRGWRTPPAYAMGQAHDDPRSRPATAEDCIGAASIVTPGTMITPSGVYASDHDMFVFMVDPERRLDDGSEGGLYRGFFCWNSEVGAASFGVSTFLFRVICGNHIVWEAQNLQTLRIRHVGDASARFGREIGAMLYKYQNASASDDEAKIATARRVRLGDTKEEALARVFGMRLQVSKGALENAYTVGEENADTDGDPRTFYGFANAMTRYSQTIPYADERVTVDRAAGKVLQAAF